MARRLALTASFAAAVMLASPAMGADPVSLDGQSTTSHSYEGKLDGPTVYTGALTPESPLGPDPRPQWCTKQTCDITDLTLRLPRGRQSGRLVIELRHDSTARMHLGVYDRRGMKIQSQDVEGDLLIAGQLEPGRYKVVVYVDAGSGGFTTNLSWKANRPHRSSSGG